jgi:ACT domain-containing protein
MTETKTIQLRIGRNKELIIEKLKSLPIVQIACEKIGISRATYYRWRELDTEFADAANKAIQEGRLFINDMAESQLLQAIKDQNMTAIIFWLKHNHVAYTTRVEITHPNEDVNKLTPQEETKINQALYLAGLLKGGEKNESKQEKHQQNIEQPKVKKSPGL